MAGGARKPANGEFEIPDLELKDPLAPKSSAPAPAPTQSNRPAASPYSGAMDDEMVVDRNVVHEPISVSVTRAKAPAIDLAREAPPQPLELGQAIAEQTF